MLQQLHGAFFTLAWGVNIAKIHGEHDVFHDGQHRQELEKLEDDAQLAAAPDSHLVFAEVMHGGAIHPDFAGGGPVDAGDHVDQGGFAGAGFADDANEFAGLKIGVDVFEHGEVTGGI